MGTKGRKKAERDSSGFLNFEEWARKNVQEERSRKEDRDVKNACFPKGISASWASGPVHVPGLVEQFEPAQEQIGRHFLQGRADADHSAGKASGGKNLHRPPQLAGELAHQTIHQAGKAEDDAAKAALINDTAVGVLAKAAKEVDATIIHVSTDYVFDGKACTPYVESDSTFPTGVYGQTKLAGEKSVIASGCH